VRAERSDARPAPDPLLASAVIEATAELLAFCRTWGVPLFLLLGWVVSGLVVWHLHPLPCDDLTSWELSSQAEGLQRRFGELAGCGPAAKLAELRGRVDRLLTSGLGQELEAVRQELEALASSGLPTRAEEARLRPGL
jgi:hypothetical protein